MIIENTRNIQLKLKLIIVILLLGNITGQLIAQNNTLKVYSPIPDDILKQYTFFLSGEQHTVHSSCEIKFYLLKYLYNYANVRNYVIEEGYAAAYLYNLYLQTGDESLICKNVGFGPYEEYRNFWRKVYSFNKNAEQKIKVIGIDENDRIGMWYKAMEVLFEQKEYAAYPEVDSLVKNIVNFSKNIHNPANIPVEKARKLQKSLKTHWQQHNAVYKLILKDDYVHFLLILKNNVALERSRYTNKYMVENLHRIMQYKQVNNGNYFGQFGVAHIINNRMSLTRLLWRDSLFKNKVFAILPYYDNCYASYIEVNTDSIYPVFSEEIIKIDNFGIIRKRLIQKSGITKSYTFLPAKKRKKYPVKYIVYFRNEQPIKYNSLYCK